MKAYASKLDKSSPEYIENHKKMLDSVEQLKGQLQKALYQGEEKHTVRHQEAGKLLARDRIELLLDQDSPFLELMPLAGMDQPGIVTGGSIVAGIGLVENIECLIIANVPTIRGGALNPVSVQKLQRLDVIARENRLPTIYLVESAGADLPFQSQIFNYGGSLFREITRRSRLGIPSVSVVFGSSTAGGAYIPGMSDYVIMVKNQAKVYLAGPPLVKMATNEETTDEALGGADMHSRLSGVSDYLAEDENHAIDLARQILSGLNYKKISLMPGGVFENPIYPAEEILGLASFDVRKPYEVREIIARLVDGSEFSEFKPLYGSTLVTCFAKIFGVHVGILANNGVLFPESANKGCQFIQLCNQKNIPLIFLQNITGFMVGQKYEESGVIKAGAKMINAVANSQVPAITIMMGASYGAGNYAMCGRAYEPRFLFSWPNARLAVMGPDQLVGVLGLLKKDATAAQAEQKLKLQIEQESTSYFSTSHLWDDGIIDPRDTRTVIGLCLSTIHTNKIEGARDYGVFRM